MIPETVIPTRRSLAGAVAATKESLPSGKRTLSSITLSESSHSPKRPRRIFSSDEKDTSTCSSDQQCNTRPTPIPGDGLFSNRSNSYRDTLSRLYEQEPLLSGDRGLISCQPPYVSLDYILSDIY